MANFGDDNGYTAMTAAEEQTVADTYTRSRRQPVVDVIAVTT